MSSRDESVTGHHERVNGRCDTLTRLKLASLVLDYYNRVVVATRQSGGVIHEWLSVGSAWRERLDVLAAVQFLNTRLPGRQVGVVDVSLGGAATLLATPSLRVDAAVLDAVYPSIDRAVKNRLDDQLGPFGTWVAPLLLLQLHARLGVAADDVKPVDHVAQLGYPLFVIAGSADRYTTIDDTRRLFAAAREPKELWVIQGAAHVDFFDFAGAAYEGRLLAFFGDAFVKAPA